MSYSTYRTSSGASRGRGFGSRGSYRGRGGGDNSNSSWNSTSPRGGRGGFSGSRGRFNWYKEHSSSGFDSRRNYASGDYAGSGADRYSSRGRTEEPYRRSYRGDVSDYSSRDHSHHRSPESQRKRMRTEHSYVQASSGRRSHEGSYGGGTDYNSRYSYGEDKGYGEDRSRGYREERRSAGFRDRSREEYRKADQLDSGMPPPSGLPRHVSSPRGPFRGRLSSRGTRGMSRMTLIRRADAILSRKRSMMDSYSVRKRILTSRAQADSLRRLKIQKLRRMRELAAKKESKGDKDSSGKGAEEISEDDDDEDDDEEEDGELGEVEDWGAEVKKEDGGEEGESAGKEDKPKAKKKVKKAAAVKEEEREEGEEIDDEEEEAEEDEEKDGEKSESPKKSETKSTSALHDSDTRVASEEGKRTTFHGKPFIRLTCPQCFMRCITFKEYSIHLYSSKHISAMRKQSLRLKQTLARMRMTQRQKQRIVEESEAEQGTLSSRTRFCPVCKLNYRQFKTKHQLSDYHRAMKKFLMPFCRVCRISFKSPMLYENHICCLDHIKREHWLKETKRLRDRSRDNGSGMEDEDKEVNLENFMTLDSVGTVDDDADEEISGEEGKSKDKEKKEGDEKKRTETNLGSEYIKKVEVLFCEMCRTYLPRLDQPERALSIHCRSRPHLQRYVRYRADRNLRREAERIHARKEAKEAAENEKSTDKKKESAAEKMVDSTTEKDGAKNAEDGVKVKEEQEADASQGTAGEDASGAQMGDSGGAEDLDQELEAGMDDKLWADVDKDLGDLLREVEPGNKSSDEDEDSRAEGGRYDRFRYSEKGNSTGPHAEGDAPDTTKAAVDGEGEGESETPQAPAKDKANEDKAETDAPPKKPSPGGNTVSSSPVAVTTN